MKIATDLDNTLMDTTGMQTALINFKNGTSYTKADIVDWDFWDKVGLGKDFWAMYDLMDSIHLRRAMPPVDPLACGIVKSLVKAGHKVDIVTANKPEAHDEIAGWLFGHGLYPDVELKIIGRVSASEKIKMDYDLFIDDSPKLIDAMREFGNGKQCLILLTQPWNAAIDVSMDENIIRARDWRHIQQILEERGAFDAI